MDDFDVEPNNATMKNFFQICVCKNIVKDKTCFKNPINPTRPKSFKGSEVLETGLSVFHRMSLTVMKVFCNKQNRKSINIESIEIFPMKLLCMN